jgi:DNA-directed RNA polymerase subunit RPC12/RpoP
MKYMGIVGMFLMAIGTIMAIFGGYINLHILFTGIMIMLVGIGILMAWSTSNFKWKCTKCGNEFKVSLTKNITGLNIGVNDKMLYCPKCNEKTE